MFCASSTSELLREACLPCCRHDTAKERRKVEDIQLLKRHKHIMEEEQTHLTAFSAKEGSVISRLLIRSGPRRHWREKVPWPRADIWSEGHYFLSGRIIWWMDGIKGIKVIDKTHQVFITSNCFQADVCKATQG